jgi:hypothetical protein
MKGKKRGDGKGKTEMMKMLFWGHQKGFIRKGAY